MRATLRRVMRVLLLVTALSMLGSLVGVAGAAASSRLPAGSAPPPAPRSTVAPTNDPNVVDYCVFNYAPNSTVSVVNNANGATGTIHTDGQGSGCTRMPVKTDCSQNVSNTIIATGTDQTGHSASSQATYTAPPNPKDCPSSSPTPRPTSTPPVTPSPRPTNTHTPNPHSCKPTKAHLTVDRLPQGANIHGTACGFVPGESVDAFAHSSPTYLGTVTAASDGTVSGTFSLPMSVRPGDHTFMYVGRTSGNVASAPFTVYSASAGSGGGQLGSGGGSGGGGGGGLAFTGADIAAMVAAAILLLVVGTLLVVAVRRRRTATAA